MDRKGLDGEGRQPETPLQQGSITQPQQMLPPLPSSLLRLLLLSLPFLSLISLASSSSSQLCSTYQSASTIVSSGHYQPLPRHKDLRDHSAVTLNLPKPIIIIFGGVEKTVVSLNSVVEDETIYAYDPLLPDSDPNQNFNVNTTSWDEEPAPRFGHASWMWKNSMYIMGGFAQTYLQDIWRLDVPGFSISPDATWRPVITSGPSPPGFFSGTVTPIYSDDEVIVLVKFGGLGDGGYSVGDLSILLATDSSTFGVCHAPVCDDYVPLRPDTVGTWSSVSLHSDSPSGPSDRSYHSATSLASSLCLYIFGGTDVLSGQIFDDLWSLCPHPTSSIIDAGPSITSSTSFLWTQISSNYSQTAFIPNARFGHIMHELTPGRLLIQGGSGKWPNRFMIDSAEFDVFMNLWIPIDLGTKPEKRRQHASTIVGDSLVFLGGLSSNNVVDTVYFTNFTSTGCGAGYALIFCEATLSLSCQPCLKGKVAKAGSYLCTDCISGTYTEVDLMEECVGCSTGKYGNGSLAANNELLHCFNCNAGKSSNFEAAPDGTSCSVCSEGTYSKSGSTQCETCPGGKYSPSESEFCYGCAAGRFTLDGYGECVNCPGGSFNNVTNSTICGSCLAGAYSAIGATVCIDCPAGTSSNADNGDGLESCSDCGQGSYQEKEGQTRCDLCLAGKSSAEFASTTADSCGACLPGYIAPLDGEADCVECEPGKYQPSGQGKSCESCSFGKYSEEPAAIHFLTCVDCGVGKYTASTGSSSASDCLGCPAGRYSLPDAGAGCYDCPRGRFTSSNAMAALQECALCETNTNADGVGKSACDACGEGKTSYLGYQECILCSSTSEERSDVETYTGMLPGFYWDDEITRWVVGEEHHAKATVYVETSELPTSGNSSYVLVAMVRGGDEMSVVQPYVDVVLDQERSMPLVVRGFARASHSEGVPSPTISIVLFVSTDNVVFTEALSLPFSPTYDESSILSNWQFQEITFFPSPHQIVKTAKVELRLEGSVSREEESQSVEWAGVGLYNALKMSCDCASGDYMNLDTPACRVCHPQPSCREPLAECYRCPAGFSCDAGVIAPCSADLFSWGGSTTCSPCEDGWVCETGIALPCASDNNLVEESGSNVCSACPPGHNCNSGVAVICSKGKYSAGGGDRAGKQCINCAPGKFAESEGQSECDHCVAGKTSNNGQENCYNCDENEVTEEEGQFPCVSCEAGKNSCPGDAACMESLDGYGMSVCPVEDLILAETP